MSIDPQKWYARQAERIGLPVELIERAFRAEFEEEHGLDAPLEIPDILVMYYKYTYGGTSRFFRELRDNRRLMATRCTSCGYTTCPPRVNCSRCYGQTEWVPLSGEGTIVAATTVHVPTAAFVGKVPYVVAYIKLDGVDTAIFQNLLMEDVSKAVPGTRVGAVFVEEPQGLMSDFYFVPVEGESATSSTNDRTRW